MSLRRFIHNSGHANCIIKSATALEAIEGGRFDGQWRVSFPRRTHRSRRWLSMRGVNHATEKDSSHAMRGSYKETSGNQYSAHLGCQDMLLDCARRLKEQRNLQIDHLKSQKWKIADLGSADGSNSIRTMQVFLDALRSDQPNKTKENITDDIPSLDIVFEEHPSSDESKLTKTVASWLETTTTSSDCESKITCNVLMKSFYESLFEPNSIDFCMSYICLHWLDSRDGVRGWKRLHLDLEKATGKGLDGFLQVNERTAPQELKNLWKAELADHHLARFLTFRARELKPGAELLLVMVSDPHEYVKPKRSHESPLLKAMKKCVADGSLRPQVLERTVIPYYLRKPQDVIDALALAQQQEGQTAEAPIHSLEIIDIRKYETLTGGIGKGNDDGMKGARDLFWDIHGGAVVNTGGAVEEEVLAIKKCLAQTFDESFDPATGVVKGNFIACVFRKKN